MISSPVYPLGTHVWVYGERTGVLLRCVVVDVSHPRDVVRHIRTKRVIEISHENARELCGSVRGNVKECPVWTIKLEGD
jgi:hypothetical protein